MRRRARRLGGWALVALLLGGAAAASAHAAGATAPAACGERLTVSFAPAAAEGVLAQLRAQGYSVHTVGEGYAAVSRCGGAAAAAAGAAATSAGPPSADGSSGVLGSLASAAAAAHGSLTARRRLREVAGMQGVTGVERDVLRTLHRPAPAAGSSGSSSGTSSSGISSGGGSGLLHAVRRMLRAVARGGLLRGTWTGATLRGHWSAADALPPPSAYTPWELDQSSCSLKDKLLGPNADAEVLPWGIEAVQGTSTLVPNRTAGSGVTVCIVDSGLWGGHPDLKGNALAGCGVAVGSGAAAAAAVADTCPFEWDADVVAHGSHVAGTIGALANGRGVVGVIPGGADIFMVRIWNTSGDVSQGQGLFATDLVRAYAACEARLDALKAARPGQKQRMVVSMSFGSAGPLTVERLWFERAAKRGDMLFVASSGNNGSDWSSYFAPPGSAQWRSYPASYDTPAMLSVANANCAGGVADTSQRNDGVDIAAPGTSVLSSVPREFEYVRGALQTSAPLPSASGPDDGGGAGSASAAPAVLMVPAGGAAAAGTVGAALARYPEPRPIQDSGVATTGAFRPVVECPAPSGAASPAATPTLASAAGGFKGAFPTCARAAGGGVCLTGLPGQRDLYEEACAAMLACLEGGGGALVAYRASDVEELRASLGGGAGVTGGGTGSGSGAGGDGYAGVGPEREVLPGARLNCGAKCECYAALKLRAKALTGGALPPGVFIGKRQALDLTTALRAAAKAAASGAASPAAPQANVTVFAYPYRHYDGTSMAAPHVAGAAARIWVDFPGCPAPEVARALKEGAKPMPGLSAISAGAGMVQVEAAYNKLRTYPCAAAGGGAAAAGR